MKITIDSADVKVENGRVTIDIDPSQINDIFNIGKVELSKLNVGDEFKLGDDIFIVLEHTDNGTKVISKESVCYSEMFGRSSNWKYSDIRLFLGQEYYKKIRDIVGKDNFILMERNLTSLGGLDDYGFCTDIISLLTVAEYEKYYTILRLKSTYLGLWWLITPIFISNDDRSSVCCVSPSYALGWDDCDCCNGVRPFLTLKSSILVESM